MLKNIFDGHGKLIGRIEESQVGTNNVFDSHGRKVGSYIKSSNMTLDSRGRMIGKGDQRMRLL